MTSLVVALMMSVAAPVPKDGQADDEFRKKVDTARDKAIKFLKEKQGKDGSWENRTIVTFAGLQGGETALVTLGLLEAGVPTNDPAIVKAVDYLLKLQPEKTYVVSLQSQVLARVDAKKYAKEIQVNADWLMSKAIIRKDKKLEGWSYPINKIADNSNTHFAVMGLHAAAQAGAKVDAEIWPKIRTYFANTQLQDGGWTYHNAGDYTISHCMSIGALACMKVAVNHDENVKWPDAAFEKGMNALLEGKLGKFGDGKSWFVSWMMTAELGRALNATEFKFGKLEKAWYRDGAEEMLKQQQDDGSFKSDEKRGSFDKGQPVISTACALYFLGPPAKKK